MLTPELDRAIADQEHRRDNAALARRILEQALKVQLRQVAHGLLADRLLTGRAVSNLDWWLQYLTAVEKPRQYRPVLDDPGFVEFRESLLADVTVGRLRRITRRSLDGVKLRILGGHARIWEDDRVNALLAGLGSSMRLMTVSSTASGLASELHDLLEIGGGGPPLDARFIFGRVAPISVSMMGALCFQFERESACAPDCSPSPGFTDGMRTVVRETILRVEIESNDETAEYEEALADRVLSVRLHEDGHVLDRYHGTVGLLSSKQFWPHFVVPRYWPLLRDDVCRFLVTSRSLDEMTDFVERFFGTWLTRATSADVLRGSACNIIDRLLQERRLEREPDGRVHCALYDDGQAWETA